MTSLRTIIFGIALTNGLLPATAKYELPRPQLSSKYTRPVKFYVPSVTYPKTVSAEAVDFESPFRRDTKIYIISLDPNSQLLKKLERLPLQNINDDSYESELPVKNNLAMLPLVNYDENSDDDNELERYNEKKSNNDAWAQLFDKNAMLYLSNPKDRVKSILRSDNTYTPQWDELSRALNVKLVEKRNEAAPQPEIYKFSDLVL